MKVNTNREARTEKRERRSSLEPNPESEVVLPIARRTVERANRQYLEGQPPGVESNSAANAPDAGDATRTRPHHAAVGEHERIGGKRSVVELAREHPPDRKPQLEIADEQPAAKELVA